MKLKVLVWLVATLAGAGATHAAAVVQSFGPTSAQSFSINNLGLTAFDTSLGSLLSVELELELSVTNTVACNLSGGASVSATYTIGNLTGNTTWACGQGASTRTFSNSTTSTNDFLGAFTQRAQFQAGAFGGVAAGTLTYTYTPTPTVAVPEPGTLALMGLALAGLGYSRRRRA